MTQNKLLQIALQSQDFIVNIRHRLHEIPELGWQETKTLALIEKEIRSLIDSSPINCELHHKEGGLYVDINIDPSFERILFRADIDALPIQEETGLPYHSKHEGLMHACGHDCHSAMLLGALKVLTSGTITPVNNLRLVWQRAEEIGSNPSGGSKLIEEGILEGISRCYGLHISSIEELGTFFSKSGHMMCNAGHLKIGIACSGGHVMRPEFGSNAIDIMTDIHTSLRGFELRHLGPNEIISFVPSISHAGTARNIRPDSGEICYAVRNFLSEKRLDDFINSVKNRVESIIKSYPKASLESFEYSSGYPSLINHPENYSFINSLLKKSTIKTGTFPYLFSGEDFSYYLNNCIGSYWVLGAMNSERTDHHSSKFNPDESILWKGTGFWLLLASTQHPKIEKQQQSEVLEPLGL